MSILSTVADVVSSVNADGFPIIITQVDVDLPDYPDLAGGWRLLLSGDNLPKAGIEITQDLQYKKTYYPGQDQAQVQVMSKKQKPFVLEGFFWSTGAARVGLLASARDITKYLHDMWQSVSLVRVQWGNNLSVVCMIKSLTRIEHRHHHVGYRLELDPIRPDETLGSFGTTESRSIFQRRQEVGSTIDQVRLAISRAQGVMARVNADTTFIGAALDAEGPGGIAAGIFQGLRP